MIMAYRAQINSKYRGNNLFQVQRPNPFNFFIFEILTTVAKAHHIILLIFTHFNHLLYFEQTQTLLLQGKNCQNYLNISKELKVIGFQ